MIDERGARRGRLHRRLRGIGELARRLGGNCPDVVVPHTRDFLRSWKRLNPEPPGYPIVSDDTDSSDASSS